MSEMSVKVEAPAPIRTSNLTSPHPLLSPNSERSSNFEQNFIPLKQTSCTVFQSSYRDEETNILYKLTATLVPDAETGSQVGLKSDQK